MQFEGGANCWTYEQVYKLTLIKFPGHSETKIEKKNDKGNLLGSEIDYIALKKEQNNEPNNNKNKEKTKKSSNNLNSLKESINSFCFGDDIDELINDENLISWDISDKNLLNLNDNNSQAISNSNSNSNTKTYFTDDDFINESFISNADVLGLTEQNFTKKKLTKDMIVFIKNKLKSDSINCSGYDIGDEGVKKLLEFMIKKNLELKIIEVNQKEINKIQLPQNFL